MNDRLVGDEVLRGKIESSPNITFYNQAKVLEVTGEDRVAGLRILKADRTEEALPVSGVFIEIGYEPSIGFDRLTDKNEKGEIKVDQNLQTSVPGIFAAGDINDAWGEQIIIAAGEGAKAAMAVSNYLNQSK
ncbi:MAG: NAD(P)/FAD-dependent oxidoreductase [Candidatus Doudnabacteria bacterium]|nr:NAD(P)/FAD-dependent oxidoreductase [Candidatus Doudnabacteria bacterium]